ncbi:ABATE domain-containing protein [Actinoplanes sp. NEAU-H7]|uniref:ABATE domain-containing protein n=1 Tax=Actinoplanes flavus TaxID=2820290 RepID=A0ABS3UNC0_9ACTN|nr:ABATE domain-containing protein [Actinoplanes flavus]MBO3740277.1 ABATE domain-containing protein [Actinoplanes flavus]
MNASCTVRPVIPAAPGADRHPGLDLANSRLSMPGGQVTDLIGTPREAARWLIERDLAPAGTVLHEICAGRLRALRERIRELFAAHVHGAEPPAEALAAVNTALTRVPTAAELRWDPATGLHRSAPHPTDQAVDHALGVLAADAADLLTGPDAARLTACDSSPCMRYLLRTGRRHWCSVRCGDRARAARAYARRADRI